MTRGDWDKDARGGQTTWGPRGKRAAIPKTRRGAPGVNSRQGDLSLPASRTAENTYPRCKPRLRGASGRQPAQTHADLKKSNCNSPSQVRPPWLWPQLWPQPTLKVPGCSVEPDRLRPRTQLCPPGTCEAWRSHDFSVFTVPPSPRPGVLHPTEWAV